ncbi:MAG: tyrosine-type recombinase/integrase [Deltaproteobacteria bacterium]|nr:tyrosine-type recombinase/integrase [Deltaproteobacteria bacterium]
MAKRNIQTSRSQASPRFSRESTFLTPEEIAAMLRVPDRRTLQGKRDYALLKTMMATGLRSAELCTLDVGHIESYRNQPVLVVNGKGGKVRRVPLHPKALETIRAYWKAEGRNGHDPGEPIFLTLGKHGPYEARRLTYKAIRHLVSRTRKEALIKRRVTPHTLRHTFAVSLLDQGVDLRTVQDLMGHASITTTQAYLHTSDEKKLAAVNALTFGS